MDSTTEVVGEAVAGQRLELREPVDAVEGAPLQQQQISPKLVM